MSLVDEFYLSYGPRPMISVSKIVTMFYRVHRCFLRFGESMKSPLLDSEHWLFLELVPLVFSVLLQ